MLLGAVLAIAALVGYTRWRGQRRERTPKSLWKRVKRVTSNMDVARRLFRRERGRDKKR
jgi:hypothetical protein